MKDNQENIDSIRNEVIHKIGNPVSRMVVLATLESFGIRNKDVSNDYGFISLDDLSKHIYEDLKSRDYKLLVNANEQKKSKKDLISISSYLWIKTKLFAQFYPLGLFHMMPIFLQIASIIAFGFSLWSFIGFNIVQSTAVVFGVILGLILSGGYVQVLGRQASFYWHHQEYKKSKMVIDKLIMSGINGMLVAFLLLGLINLFFSLYPFTFILIIFTYAFLIGLLLLVIAPFHTIRHRWLISIVILLATGFSLLLKNYTTLNIYVIHWSSIILAIIFFKCFLEIFFRKYKKLFVGANIIPKKLMVIYKNYNYFFYGVLVYIFVFLDRILAWSADINYTQHFIFLYEKNYEIGMDIAILLFFMLAGVLEYAIASFNKFMDIKQKNILLVQREHFGKSLFKMYKGHILLLAITAIVTAIFIYLLVTQPWGYQAKFGEGLNNISKSVCVIGCFGYFFLTWGMLNTLYLFTLGIPKQSLKSLIIACFVNFILGFVLSRLISYEYSSVGMLIGSIVFMALTLKGIIKFFKKLDHHYYAAY